MKWYRLYKESNVSDFVIKNGVLEDYKGRGGNVVIPDGVYSIGGYAFAECSELTSVRIPNSVEIINQRAFHRCRNLTIVRIPDSVTTIGREAFNRCYSLTRLTLGDSVKIIGSGAFGDCDNLRTIQVEGKTDEEAKDLLEGAVDDLSIVKGGDAR